MDGLKGKKNMEMSAAMQIVKDEIELVDRGQG